jgi:mono/diheme cytochrome c family protein
MFRLLAFLLCMAAASCTRSNMDSQPKYHEYESSRLFENGRVLQAPVAGTVARDDLAQEEEAANKPAVTAELLSHGREQYNVFCSPCHDRTGSGRGIVVERGMPQPASFHEQRLRDADDEYFFDAITKGFGAMYSYSSRIRARDRWAIIAYLRALQLSQHVAVADLPDDLKARLPGQPP